jgi:hypothetical protein
LGSLEVSEFPAERQGALQEVRAQHQKFDEHRHASELRTFESMLIGMFNSMNEGFENVDLAGPQPISRNPQCWTLAGVEHVGTPSCPSFENSRYQRRAVAVC